MKIRKPRRYFEGIWYEDESIDDAIESFKDNTFSLKPSMFLVLHRTPDSKSRATQVFTSKQEMIDYFEGPSVLAGDTLDVYPLEDPVIIKIPDQNDQVLLEFDSEDLPS